MAASPLPRHQTNLADERDKANEKYREIILGLPKEKGWRTRHLCQYQGFWYDIEYGILGVMSVQQYFKAKPTDILLATSPKSGTTWLKALSYATVNRSRFVYLTHPLLTTNPHQCVRFLELDLFCNGYPNEEIESMPSPRLFASHIPYTALPESLINSACKIVYLCRDPKDIFVSFWHFLTKLRDKSLPPLSLQEAFDLFSKGASPFGPSWDHMLGYWKASLESPSKVLFLKYEDMKKEPLVYLKRLANFLQYPFTLEEANDGTPDAILELGLFKIAGDPIIRSDIRKNRFENRISERRGWGSEKSSYYGNGRVTGPDYQAEVR
ncbi:hypothetical protein Ancab_015332 [Ancistrocladus abbreviatus]